MGHCTWEELPRLQEGGATLCPLWLPRGDMGTLSRLLSLSRFVFQEMWKGLASSNDGNWFR